MTQNNRIAQVLEVLRSDPDSTVHRYLERQPATDYEYLQFWFDYLELRYGDRHWLRDLIRKGIPEQLLNAQAVHAELVDLLQTKRKEVENSLEFTPRLERYLQEFPAQEREQTRLVILGYISHAIKQESARTSLVDLARRYRISDAYIFSMDRSHKLIQDRVIEIEEDDVFTARSLHFRDLVFNYETYAIFAGLDVPEEDLVSLQQSVLIALFDLPVSADETGSDLTEAGEAQGDNGQDHTPFSSLEDILQETDDPSRAPDADEGEWPEEATGPLQPYQDNLEYLYGEYRWLRLLKKKMEMYEDAYIRDEQGGEKAFYTIKHNITKLRQRCNLRTRKSEAQGFLPRIERVARRLSLNEFEKNVLKVLTADAVFIDPSQRRLKSDGYTVGALLGLLLEDERDQVRAKKAFLKTAPLVRSNLIQLSDGDRLNWDIYDINVRIDNRLIEYFLGEEYDISDYIDGSFLYTSTIPMAHVILPDKMKTGILTTVENFPAFLRAKDAYQMSEIVEYGNALVMLFVGPSGTGKTMLANALSNHLDKEVLLFNLNNLAQMESLQGESQLFSLLFREARMNNAILFFDESEVLLQERFTDMLLEIEKHEGIVIFATNAPLKITEAMRRRINLVVEFPEPGPALRKQIWEVHIPDSLPLADDVDLDEIARRFELNGGLIKNALFSALAHAVNEHGTDAPVLHSRHLEAGAREQLQNKLFMSNIEDQRIPEHGLGNVILPEATHTTLREIVNVEKAKKVLEGEWGFQEVFTTQQGIAVLMHGPPGTGKSLTAEAIAYETGKHLKVVNYAQVLSMWVGETEKALETLFKEVAGSNSILLFNEAEALFATRTEVSNASDRYANIHTDYLLDMVERHNTFAILTTNSLDYIDEAFFRRMQYIIEFTAPDQSLRTQLWQTLLPRKLPLAPDVDIETLAADYAFTGGDIKNAIFRAATKRAIDLEASREVTMYDFRHVCDEIRQKKSNGHKMGF